MSPLPVHDNARALSSSDSDRARAQGVVSDEELQPTFEGVASARPLGSMSVSSLGAGRLVVIAGDARQVICREAGRRDSTSETFVLVANIGSIAELSYRARDSLLPFNALALLDGAHGWRLRFAASYEQLAIQFPRALIGRRHPDLLRSGGLQPVVENPVTRLLVQMASVAAPLVPAASPAARGHLSDAMVSMLGALSCVVSEHRSTAERHLEGALADIDARLSDPDLCPAAIAGLRGISRRRLDAILAERGLSVTRVIWDRKASLQVHWPELRNSSPCAARCFAEHRRKSLCQPVPRLQPCRWRNVRCVFATMSQPPGRLTHRTATRTWTLAGERIAARARELDVGVDLDGASLDKSRAALPFAQ